MKKELESKGRTESVKVRERHLSNGTISLYLDILHNGKRSREFLKLYLFEGNSREIKERNKLTLAQAEAVRAEKQIQLQSNQYEVLHEFKTNTYFLPYYRNMCEERFKTESRGNWGNWRSCLRYLELYCDESTTFNEITPEWVKGFKKYLDTVEKDYYKHTEDSHNESDIFNGLSQNSKVSYFNKLKACINQAVEERIIPVNPLRGIKGFKTEEVKREYLSWDEVCKLDATPCKYPYLKNSFLFSCFTGLRKIDIERLTWAEVQAFDGYTRIVFKQKKTGGQEYLDIPKQAEKYLGPRGNLYDKVFKGFNYNSWFLLELKRWVMQAGITKDITFHCGRHTFAVLMLNFGADIYTVSKLLGHRELATTQVYARVLDKKKQEALALFPDMNH